MKNYFYLALIISMSTAPAFAEKKVVWYLIAVGANKVMSQFTHQHLCEVYSRPSNGTLICVSGIVDE